MLCSPTFGTAEADNGLGVLFRDLAGSEDSGLEVSLRDLAEGVDVPLLGRVEGVAVFAAEAFFGVLPLLLLIGTKLAPFLAPDLLEEAEEVVDLGANLRVDGGVAMSISPFAAS